MNLRKPTTTYFYRCVAILVAGFFLAAVFPCEVFAEVSVGCSPQGYTIVFVNGAFDTQEKAEANATALQLALDSTYKTQPIYVQLAYNAEHLGGAGDLIETMSQMLFAPISDYDFHDVLRQLSEKDATQKLLLIGHSQGALYANNAYEYLTARGEPANSLGLYAVATPASYIAGGGMYVNSSDDAVIYTARAIAQKLGAPLPLASNLNLSDSVALLDLPQTHEFLTYLKGAHERVRSEIYGELDTLRGWQVASVKTARCIVPPEESFYDVAQKLLFSLADPAAEHVKATVVSAYQDVAAVVTNTLAIAQFGYNALSSVFGAFTTGQVVNAKNNPLAPQNQEKNFGVMKKVYGSSIDKDTYEELNPNQGAAVALALVPSVPPTTTAISQIIIPVTTATTSLGKTATSTASTNSSPVFVYVGGTGLPPPFEARDSERDSTTSTETIGIATTSPIEPEDPIATSADDTSASSTPSLPIEIATTTEATSSPVAATSSPAVPTGFVPEHSPISDTFDSFNSIGWEAFGDDAKNFDFDDGADGECFHGGCAVGMGRNAYDGAIPRMYIQTEIEQHSGAYTFYAKARAGFNNPFSAITICETGFNHCGGNGSAQGIHFLNPIPLDNTWHQYYVAWKQGNSFVQSCFMQTDTDPAHCEWVDTELASSTTFNGIALWSTAGWRADVPPHANLWFDELVSQ